MSHKSRDDSILLIFQPLKSIIKCDTIFINTLVVNNPMSGVVTGNHIPLHKIQYHVGLDITLTYSGVHSKFFTVFIFIPSLLCSYRLFLAIISLNILVPIWFQFLFWCVKCILAWRRIVIIYSAPLNFILHTF